MVRIYIGFGNLAKGGNQSGWFPGTPLRHIHEEGVIVLVNYLYTGRHAKILRNFHEHLFTFKPGTYLRLAGF